MKTRGLLLLCTLFLIISSFNTQNEKKNLIVNGDFEMGNEPWGKWGGLELDKEIRHTGEVASRIVGENNKWKGSNQFIELPEGTKKIKLSGWMKTKDITPNGEAWNNARMSIHFKSDKETKVKPEWPPAIGAASGTTDWTLYTNSYDIPEGCKLIEIYISCGTCTGTAWYDDIELVVVE